MKKLIAVLLVLVMVIGLVACGAEEAASKEEEKQEEAAPAEEKEEEKEEEPAPVEEPTPAKTLYVVNNFADDMEPVYDDFRTKYNAYWLDAYSISKFAEDNFWYMPEDDDICTVISFADLYDYNAGFETPLTWATFKDQYFCLNVPEDLAANYPTGTLCGTGLEKDYLPYNQGYIICGPEAIILPTTDEEGYVCQYLFEDLGMVAAEEYEFHCGDGYVHPVAAADLADEYIYMDETGRVHANCIEWPDYPLMDIQFIVATGYDENSTPAEEGITKINFANNGVGVLDAENTKASETVVLVEGATVKAPLGGSTQNGYPVADLLAAMGVPACETVTAISYVDGSTLDQTYDDFIQKFIVLTDSKDRAPYTVGTVQPYGNVVKNTGYFVMGDSVLLCVPATATKEQGICMNDVLAALGIEGVTAANVVCSDGYSEEIDAEDFADLFIFYNEDKVDTSSIAYPEYTLGDAAYIEIYQ